jgi:Zn-dependent M32 family carboxypeptidase
MHPESQDPRNIPILTDAVDNDGQTVLSFDIKAMHAAILTATLELADSLLHQAAKDIEATLFEQVFDQLRAQLPELVDRVLREHAASREDASQEHAPPDDGSPGNSSEERG